MQPDYIIVDDKVIQILMDKVRGREYKEFYTKLLSNQIGYKRVKVIEPSSPLASSILRVVRRIDPYFPPFPVFILQKVPRYFFEKGLE